MSDEELLKKIQTKQGSLNSFEVTTQGENQMIPEDVQVVRTCVKVKTKSSRKQEQKAEKMK